MPNLPTPREPDFVVGFAGERPPGDASQLPAAQVDVGIAFELSAIKDPATNHVNFRQVFDWMARACCVRTSAIFLGSSPICTPAARSSNGHRRCH